MARVCALTWKRTRVWNNVSKSVRRTKRTFRPNLFERKLTDPQTWICFKVKLSAKGIKTLKKKWLL